MSLAADYTNTPTYISPYRPMSRSKTTYGSMNEWMVMKHSAPRTIPSHVPVTLSDANWREVKNAPSTPFRPFKDDNRTDEYYRRYLQLSGNVAYRYPEPGYPRERQGAMGGTWRHIKEVLGYGGSQVCFVDGLVRLYDYENKRQNSPSKQLPHMRTSIGTPAYAANRHNVSSYGKTLQQELEKSNYKPWIDPKKQQMPSIQETSRAAHMPGSPGMPGKYKGFYSYPGHKQ